MHLVLLSNEHNQNAVVTDAEGRFRIEGLKAGNYEITTDHPGYVQSGSPKQSRLILRQGEVPADLVLHMQPAAVITGKIVDEDGDPISNVSVSAQRAAASRSFRRQDSGFGSTNDLGEFRIPDLRAGHYTLMATPPEGLRVPHPADKNVSHDNVIYTTTYYPGTLDKQDAGAVEVHPGDEVPITFGLLSSAAYRLSGTIVGLPKDAPLVQVILSSKEQGRVQDQQLREGGKFEFQNVLPGSYFATVMVITGLFSGGRPGAQVKVITEADEP